MFLTLPNCPGGGPQSVPSRISVELVDEAKDGGGAMPIAAPRQMTNNDVSNTPELSGGTSVGPLQKFGGVGRWDQGWGHSRMGVST